VAVVGPSGAGKTTLLSLLNGSLAPTTGSVHLLGRDLSELNGRERRHLQSQVGTVHQQLHLVGPIRVVHNVNAGQLGRWPLWKAAWSLLRPMELAAAELALARVGVGEKLYERTDRLSLGQQQRVAIARVLVQDPLAIVADEPVSSLDPARGREVMDILRHLAVELGKTLVVSLHDFEYALSHCQRIVGLRTGRVLFDEPADRVSPTMLDELYALDASAPS
jgi:phosphonate transport system ATP-binding protein